MPICNKRKLAFCHIPRTGGVSVTDGLNMQVVDRHAKVSFFRENYPDYKVFTIFRKHEDRISSAFGWKNPEHYNKPSLDALVESVKLRDADDPGSIMLKPNEFFLDGPVDYQLRFENLQEDLDNMLVQLGFDKVILTKCNSFR